MQAMILPGQSPAYAPCSSWVGNSAPAGGFGAVMATTPVAFALVPDPPKTLMPTHSISETAMAAAAAGRRRLRSSGWSLLSLGGWRGHASAAVSTASSGLATAAAAAAGLLHPHRSLLQQGGGNGAFPHLPPPPTNGSASVLVRGNFTSGTDLPIDAFLFDLYGQV